MKITSAILNQRNYLIFTWKQRTTYLRPDTYAGKNSGGSFKIMASLVSGPGHQRIFEHLQRFLKKIGKYSVFSPILTKIQNRKIFARLDENHNCWGNFENIFWWKFNRKLNYYLFFGKYFAKNKAFWNNIIFLQQFFPVRGVWAPLTPAYAAAWALVMQYQIHYYILDGLRL